ncbi:MAG: C39 family peptidase [Chloroflexi bacterium]|nr:C39 family peptidase [Chloroflexota bacterium]
MKKSLAARLAFWGLLCIGALSSSGFTSTSDNYWTWELEHGKLNLPAKAILQSEYTSCGEAVITMTHNYAYPEAQISELDVIDYASSQGYYTARRAPFTSPENMVKIASHFANTVSAGAADNADDALAFLTQKLTSGDPVIIDIRTRLYDPTSSAHFVVVTGMSIDKNPNWTKIYFNDPLTGTNRWGYWLGVEGVWDAWQNNGDPGGRGWWMIISSP